MVHSVARNKSNSDLQSPMQSLIAGALAGAVSKTLTAPIERVKLLLQLRDPCKTKISYGTTFWQVAKTVYREEGFLAFWRGNTPSVLQKGGNAALNFMLMDWYKATILFLMSTITPTELEREKRSFRIVNSFLSAGLSGATTTTILYPMEFLRTRLAVDKAPEKKQTSRSGIRDTFKTIWRSDGMRGLYQGYGTSIWYVTLHRVFYLGGFDVLKMEVLRFQRAKGISEHQEKESLTMTERVFVAQFVSLSAGALVYPLDTVRRRLMMQAGRKAEERLYATWRGCIVKVWTEEGPRAFFRGLVPHLAKTVGGALLLVAYDYFRGVV